MFSGINKFFKTRVDGRGLGAKMITQRNPPAQCLRAFFFPSRDAIRCFFFFVIRAVRVYPRSKSNSSTEIEWRVGTRCGAGGGGEFVLVIMKNVTGSRLASFWVLN